MSDRVVGEESRSTRLFTERQWNGEGSSVLEPQMKSRTRQVRESVAVGNSNPPSKERQGRQVSGGVARS